MFTMAPRTTPIILVAFLALAIPFEAAAESSGKLVLSGVVPLSCEIDVQPQPVADNLDVSRRQSDLLVASVHESCNNATGYDVSVASLGGGSLKADAASLSYTLMVADHRPALSESGAVPVAVASEMASRGAVKRPVRISYPAASSVPGAHYTDTLTFTITAK